jgi:hypothetical protein
VRAGGLVGPGQVGLGAQRRLAVDGHPVVAAGPDPALAQVRGERVGRGVADDVQAPRRVARRRRQRDVLAEPARRVRPPGRPARGAPAVELRELHAQDRRLQLVQPRLPADLLVRLLVPRAVEAQPAHAVGQRGVARRHRAAVAERPERLRRVEREGRERALRPGPAPVALGARRLGGVLDDGDPELGLDLADRRHVAEQVDEDRRLRRRRERRPHRLDRHDRRRRVDVAEHGPRPGERDRHRARVEREARHHDVVPRPDAERPEGDRDRLRAVGHADGVLHAAPRRPLALERLDLGAEHEPAAVEDAGDRRVDPRAQRQARGHRVEQGDGHGG